jgi:LacI family repressor for deo operon, udp, cdd, tsx, nupC, and nupG
MGFGAMSVLRGAGLRCPDDVSIAAFDDHPMSRWWGLTTVTQHAHEQGVRAAHAMIGAVSGNGHAAEQDTPADLKVELLVRDTTGPARTDASA